MPQLNPDIKPLLAWYNVNYGEENAIHDLITDLLHLADSEGLDVESLNASAFTTFEGERAYQSREYRRRAEG